MTKRENDTARPDRAGGCCGSDKKNSAQVAETGVESFPASDAPDKAPGREEPATSCCQSSKGTVAEKKGGHEACS